MRINLYFLISFLFISVNGNNIFRKRRNILFDKKKIIGNVTNWCNNKSIILKENLVKNIEIIHAII